MTKKRLFFDMDNVLVDFQSGLDQIDAATKAKYIDANEKPHYDDIPGIFSLMKPVDGAIEAVKTLAKVYDVYILSTAPWNNPSAWSDKVKWVKKQFGDDENNPFYKRMIITHRKDLCEGDILIDDRGKNGTSEFKGEWIQFGSRRFPDWSSVKQYLLDDSKPTNTAEIEKESRFSIFKRNVCEVLNKRNNYSSLIWLLLIIGEVLAFLWIRGFDYILGEWTIYGTLIVGLLIFILWRIGQHQHHDFRVRSIILTRLLANAIAPKKIGAIYLVLFVIHIGWLTNAVMCLFTDDNLNRIMEAIVVCAIGTIIITAFFPNGKGKINGNTKSMVVSGISKIFPYNEYDAFNLLPFVRIFQQVDADAIWVIMSDIFIKEGYVSPSVYVSEEQKKEKPLKFKSFTEETIRPVLGEEGKKTPTKVLEMKLGKITEKSWNLEEIKKDLEQVIREIARIEFYDEPEKLEIIDKCNINFTDFVTDYNNYQDSFSQISTLVQSLDTDETILFFNLTPGTVTLSSVMTLIAIDGDRRLYYYSQETNIPVDLKMKKVDKKMIPLENLLSQALENVIKSD